MFVLNIIFVVFVCLLNLIKCEVCPLQIDYVTTNSKNSTVRWFWIQEKSQSVPLCLNNQYEILERKCFTSGKWGSAPHCDKVVYESTLKLTTKDICPAGFEHFQDQKTKKYFCYNKSYANLKGPPTVCPYQNPISVEENNFWRTLPIESSFWLPFRRNASNGLYENVYNKRTALELEKSHFVIGRDCVLFNVTTGSPEPVACTGNFSTLCVYQSFYNISLRGINCVYAINRPTECFFTSYSKASTENRNAFCKSADTILGEPKLRNQIHLLNTTKEGCWLGIERATKIFDGEKDFVWSQSKTQLLSNVTLSALTSNWQFDANFSGSDYGAVRNVFNLKPFWYLYPKETNLNCAICQINLNYDQLRLIIDNSTVKLEPQNSDISIQDLNLKCFTNALGSIVNEVAYVCKSNKKNVCEMSLANFRGQYWCNVYLPGMNLIESNTVTLQKPELRDYSVVAVNSTITFNEPVKNPRSGFVIKQISDELMKNVIEIYNKRNEDTKHLTLGNVRVMQVNAISNNTFNYIFHLTCGPHMQNKLFPNIAKNIRDVGRNLTNAAQIVINDVALLDHCMESTTISASFTLKWAATEAGKVAKIKNTCIVLGPNDYLSRECKEDVLRGAEWGPVIGTCKEIQYCPGEQTRSGSFILRWNKTVAGNTSEISPKVCLNALPPFDNVKRKCDSDGNWEAVVGQCKETNTYSGNTEIVYELLRRADKENEIAVEKALELSRNKSALNSEDVDVLAYVLKTTAESFGLRSNDKITITNQIELASNMIDLEETNESLLKKNTTQIILKQIDRIAAESEVGLEAQATLQINTPNILMQVSNIKANNFAWMTLNRPRDSNQSLEWKNLIETPKKNSEKLPEISDCEMMVEVPKFEMLTGEIERPKVSVVMFNKDTLFPDSTDTKIDRIVRVAADVNDSSVRIVGSFKVGFKLEEMQCNTTCVSWEQGKWSQNNVETEFQIINGTRYALCTCTRLANFAVLVGENTFDHIHAKVLSILTTIGCSFSSFGILFILATALVFKSWRSDSGHYILTQFAIIVLFKYILLYLSGMGSKQRTSCDMTSFCVAIATMLHYILLSEFTWMLILAILQYKRLVTVFHDVTPRLIITVSVTGWLAPLIPTLIVFLYNRTLKEPMYNSQICYLTSYSLYIGILLPIGFIIFFNMAIFAKIIATIVSSKQRMKNHSENQQRLWKISLKLGIFLFSLLGLSWLFGLLLAFTGHVAFAYMFCITGTLQGVVMFLYFIVWNEKTRKMWSDLLKCSRFKRSLDITTSARTRTTSGSGTRSDSVIYKSGDDQSLLVDSVQL